MSSSTVRLLSCEQCKKRKVKCDRRNPCGQCTARGQANSCKALVQYSSLSATSAVFDGDESSSRRLSVPNDHDGEASPHDASASFDHTERERVSNRDGSRAGRQTSTPDEICNANHELLLDRLLALEGRVKELERGDRQRPTEGIRNGNGKRTDRNEVTAHPRPPLAITDRERISLMLEDVAMDYRGKRARLKDEIAAAGTERRYSPTYDTSDVASGSGSRKLDQRTADHIVDIMFQYIGLLRFDQRTVMELVAFYFDEVDWFAKPFDKSAFLEQMNRLFVNEDPTESISQDVRQIEPSFFCCFLMVICLSLHLMDEDQLTSIAGLRGGSKQAEALAESLFAGAQQTLWASNFLGACRIDHLACVVLMGLYQYDKRGQADAHWTLLGAAIRSAQNMGLSDLDNAPNWRRASVASIERARRIWWTLIWYDWSHAFGHNGHYSVAHTQNKTRPAEGGEWGPKINGDMFTVARSQLVCFYREATDTFYRDGENRTGTLHDSQLETLDRRLNDVIVRLPFCFLCHNRLPTEEHLQSVTRIQACEVLFIRLTVQNRILRLHRHAQNASSDLESHQKCLDAARVIIDLVDLAQRFAPVLVRLWVVVLYGLGAALVLFMEQRQRRQGGLSFERDEIDSKLDALLALFEANQIRSHSARNAARLLRRLRRSNAWHSQHDGHTRRDHPAGEQPWSNGGDGTETEDDVAMKVIESFIASSTQHQRSGVRARERSSLNDGVYRHSSHAYGSGLADVAAAVGGVVSASDVLDDLALLSDPAHFSAADGQAQDTSPSSLTDAAMMLEMWKQATHL